jgi:hypothetical protein
MFESKDFVFCAKLKVCARLKEFLFFQVPGLCDVHSFFVSITGSPYCTIPDYAQIILSKNGTILKGRKVLKPAELEKNKYCPYNKGTKRSLQ